MSDTLLLYRARIVVLASMQQITLEKIHQGIEDADGVFLLQYGG